MPRKHNSMFVHSITWAPSDPNVNVKYGARVQRVYFKGGKVHVEWSIYTAYTKQPRKAKVST